MYQITLSDIMKDIGVRKHPDYFSGIKVKHKPMPHQLEMMKIYSKIGRASCRERV